MSDPAALKKRLEGIRDSGRVSGEFAVLRLDEALSLVDELEHLQNLLDVSALAARMKRTEETLKKVRAECDEWRVHAEAGDKHLAEALERASVLDKFRGRKP